MRSSFAWDLPRNLTIKCFFVQNLSGKTFIWPLQKAFIFKRLIGGLGYPDHIFLISP